MGNVSWNTWARAIALALALVNQIITSAGYNPLPFSEDTVYSALTGIFTLAASVWSFWKNNSFTVPAIKADEYLKGLKEDSLI